MTYQDKIQHFSVCFTCVVVLGWLAKVVLGPIGQIVGLVLGTFIAIAWGFWKEIDDSDHPGNKFDWWDILADCLGIIMAWVIS